MTDELPTARSMAPSGFRVHVWCKTSRHSVDADLDALIRAGKGHIPLVQFKWRCGNCRWTSTRRAHLRSDALTDASKGQ